MSKTQYNSYLALSLFSQYANVVFFFNIYNILRTFFMKKRSVFKNERSVLRE